MERPDLLADYDDYREYLKDWYRWMKGKKPGFSYRAFSKWAGFRSPNHLQLVIQGKRNITARTLVVFVDILKLSRRERRYFELLVGLSRAGTPEAKAACLLDISSAFKNYKNNLKHSQIEYLTKWYYAVIRELVTIKNFSVSRHAIARRIGHGVTPRHVDEAIAKLIELGLLVRTSDGGLKQSQAVVTTGPEVMAASSYLYHDQMMRLALDSLKKQPSDERNFSAVTFACRKEDLREIVQILSDCRHQVLAYLEGRGELKDDEVYQFNLQLFRLTQKEG